MKFLRVMMCFRGPKVPNTVFRSNQICKYSNIAQDNRDTWALRRIIVPSIPGRYDERPDGIKFDVGYIDSGADWHFSRRNSSPVVLAVHGMPADHDDMLPIVKPLHDEGCRVIAVNLPGYEYSRVFNEEEQLIYRHSTVEMTEFLITFLQTLKIKQVDMLVAHSGGALPSVVLTGMSNFIKSLMCICSMPGQTHPKSAMPHLFWLWGIIIRMYDSKIGRFLADPLIRAINQRTVKFRGGANDLANTVRMARLINFKLLCAMALEVEMKKIPLVFAYSKNDPLMEYEKLNAWAEKLGITGDGTIEYDENFHICKEAVGDPLRKAVVLHRGGHFPQHKTETALPILIKEAKDLLQKIKNVSKS